MFCFLRYFLGTTLLLDLRQNIKLLQNKKIMKIWKLWKNKEIEEELKFFKLKFKFKKWNLKTKLFLKYRV